MVVVCLYLFYMKIKSSPKTQGSHSIMVMNREGTKEVTLYQFNRLGVAGRPLKFSTPHELEERIEEYYEYCEKNNKPYTITALANFLDIDRRNITEYGYKDEFRPIIQKAKQNCLAYAEGRLFSGTPVGSMFYLKNNYRDLYKDDKHVEVTQNININEIMGVWDKKNTIEGELVQDEENPVSPQLPEENGSTETKKEV